MSVSVRSRLRLCASLRAAIDRSTLRCYRAILCANLSLAAPFVSSFLACVAAWSAMLPVPRHDARGGGAVLQPIGLRPAGVITVTSYLVGKSAAHALNKASTAKATVHAACALQRATRVRKARRELQQRRCVRLVRRAVGLPGQHKGSVDLTLPPGYYSRRGTRADGGAPAARVPSRMCVVVLQLRGLADVSSFMSQQSPYVQVTLLPEGAEAAAEGFDAVPFDKERESLGTARSSAIESGGTAVVFSDRHGSALRPRLCNLSEEAALDDTRAQQEASAYLLEVWDENMMSADELVGNVVRPLTTAVGCDSDSDSSERRVTVEWVPLQPQGEARIAIICED